MATKFQSFDTLKYETETETDTYPTWETSCKSALVLAGLWGYISGRGVTVPAKEIIDPASTDTPPGIIDNPRWEDYLEENLIVISCLRLRIGETDQRIIKDETIASEAWAKLKAAHLPTGALSQLTILQEALAIRFTRETPLKQTSDKLQKLIDQGGINFRILYIGSESFLRTNPGPPSPPSAYMRKEFLTAGPAIIYLFMLYI
ncbi:hypothetical protein C8R43DRAFT_1240279 [Mycena crocata]|nr:hypothetical protein C8R43DRAFT_1240279 [Mycena crocata]